MIARIFVSGFLENSVATQEYSSGSDFEDARLSLVFGKASRYNQSYAETDGL